MQTSVHRASIDARVLLPVQVRCDGLQRPWSAIKIRQAMCLHVTCFRFSIFTWDVNFADRLKGVPGYRKEGGGCLQACPFCHSNDNVRVDGKRPWGHRYIHGGRSAIVVLYVRYQCHRPGTGAGNGQQECPGEKISNQVNHSP